MIAKVANDSIRLNQKKPTRSKHRVTQTIDPATNQVQLQSVNYNDRLRRDQVSLTFGCQDFIAMLMTTLYKHIQMSVVGTAGEYSVPADIAAVSGKDGSIDAGDRALTNTKVMTVTSIGRDDPTTAEATRAATVLRILQGHEKLLDSSPWIQNIWFINDNSLITWPPEWSPVTTKPKLLPPRSGTKAHSGGNLGRRILNPSQQKAVNSMLSEEDSHRITIVQGPPGTGKTSVISTYVEFAVQQGRRGIWLVAQSNVAVKNIAEKLVSNGFEGWKLLVSKDFHYDW